MMGRAIMSFNQCLPPFTVFVIPWAATDFLDKETSISAKHDVKTSILDSSYEQIFNLFFKKKMGKIIYQSNIITLATRSIRYLIGRRT